MSLTVQVAGKSDLGCVRTNNEDNFGYDTRYGVFVVCDGMGGQAAGEVASKMGVDTILDYFRKAGGETGKYPVEGQPMEGVSERANALASSIRLANRASSRCRRDAPWSGSASQGYSSYVIPGHVAAAAAAPSVSDGSRWANSAYRPVVSRGCSVMSPPEKALP